MSLRKARRTSRKGDIDDPHENQQTRRLKQQKHANSMLMLLQRRCNSTTRAVARKLDGRANLMASNSEPQTSKLVPASCTNY